MQLSQADRNLLDILDAAGEIILDILSNYSRLEPEGRKEKRINLESSVRNYVHKYKDTHNEAPSNYILKEAIDWYVDWAFHHETKYLSDLVGGMMMDLIVEQAARYGRESYERMPEYVLVKG